jgi:hypothetical protein|nr:MAG TPA_asm: hypothetical protein [Caudoviricetes sp.]
MAIEKLSADLNIISKLGDYPLADDGLEPDQFKAKFDEAGKLIKQYINEVLVPSVDELVDVDALLKGILDTTLTKADKAANAKATGTALNAHKAMIGTVLENAYDCGDFVIPGGNAFAYTLTAGNPGMAFTVKSGMCVMQGNLIKSSAEKKLSIMPAAEGTCRNDLIVLRVIRDANGYDTVTPRHFTGEISITAAGAKDPMYTEDDINAEVSDNTALARDLPLYRVRVKGTEITVEQLFSVGNVTNITLSKNGWGEIAPYTQSVTVFGLADKRKHIVTAKPTGTNEQRLAMLEACACVSFAERDGQTLTFTCLEEKPAVDIYATVEVR